MSEKNSYPICGGCKRQFRNLNAISTHWQKNLACATASAQADIAENNFSNNKVESNLEDNDFPVFTNNSTDDIDFNDAPGQYTSALMELHKNHVASLENIIAIDDNHMKSAVNLLNILKKAKAPLYLFDEILDWARKSVNQNDMDLGSNHMITRTKAIQQLKEKYDLNIIEPRINHIQLPGSNAKIDLVVHSFKHSFYSLLNDKNLMQADNLLLDPDNPYNNPTSNYCGDVNTGSVFLAARKEYIRHEKEVLCPIIFFIDKTHTDINGRLCLEPIRFTLAIFNRETRKKPIAWRTLGYIFDQAQVYAKEKKSKVVDYHYMMEVILEEFKALQTTSLQWRLKLNDKEFEVFFRIPVLFIIGDTDGQDKICGRYTSRSNIQSLCRCCTIPFDATDDPEYTIKYRKHEALMKIVARGDPQQLKKHSMHYIKNAWRDVKFCDSTRGLFGALCGDLMHCLQHGLFMYLVTMLFDQKKIKNLTSDKNSQEIFSSKSAFSESYCRKFDNLSRHYGKLMMHQSDRGLPRTYFYSSYVSIARKNASEMSGILLVYLIVLNSSEGQFRIDEQLGEGRTANFIQIIELMLMLEAFCMMDEVSKKSAKALKQFMPYLLNKYKTTLNRQVGCQMKIIKFHLPLHFAEDMLRFGSMKNFDTSIGESHHKTEAKLPAKNTQRRRASFEIQTAKRQIDNLALGIAVEEYQSKEDEKASQPDQSNKWFRYVFNEDSKHLCFYTRTSQQTNIGECKWKDKVFQKQIEAICVDLVERKCVDPPFRFFAQHNRGNNIFRADPSYEKGLPWYDWAQIQWAEGKIPSKLLLFWEISADQFNKPFKIGSTAVDCPGTYAIAYSLASKDKTIKAHGISKLVLYSTIDVKSDLCIFSVDCIESPITGLPFNVNDNLIEAKEWIFLKHRNEWPDIFQEVIAETISENQNDRKRKR